MAQCASISAGRVNANESIAGCRQRPGACLTLVHRMWMAAPEIQITNLAETLTG